MARGSLGAFIVEKVRPQWRASGSTANWSKGRLACRAAICDSKWIYSLGWRVQVPIKQGIALTYPWIEEQVKKARQS